MPDEDDQTQVRVAWLYYMEGLTQAEVAGRLKITRLRVNRLLVEARAKGLVNISLNSALSDCIRLEQALVKECGLKDAVIVPTPQHRDLVAPVIGRAAGEHLSRISSRPASCAGSGSAGARPCARRSATSARADTQSSTSPR